ALIRAMSPAHRGATALVPPYTALVPSTNTLYPVCGSASAAMSGTPRLASGLRLPSASVASSPCCQAGRAKNVLTPPPLAPLVASPSFHTSSLAMAVPLAWRLVPPQARAYELEAGKSTWLPPSVSPSLEPLSPEATHTVMPIAAAAWKAWSMAVIACCVQVDSGPPQLIEITEGLRTSS